MTRVQVTWWRPAEGDAGRMQAFLPWLSPGERARHERYFDAAHRVAFLASRILLRHSLAAIAGASPSALRFSTDAHGIKPYLTAPAAARDWHFSLTHTEGLFACAVGRSGDLGIDAEPLDRVTRIEAVARRVLSPDERGRFDSLAPEQRRRRFFEYWCVKEAWLKAEGTGLRVPPASVEVEFDADGGVRVAGQARTVRLLPIAPAYVVALVHPGPADAEIAVQAFAWDRLDP